MTVKAAIKILVIDDDPFMLKLIGHLLNTLGYRRVTSCDNGWAALETFDNPPDLILLDLNMPEMDGIEFMRHLVERHYAGYLILVSGEDERMLQTAEKLVNAHKIHTLGHLRKPINPSELSEMLQNWMPPSQSRTRSLRKVYPVEAVRAAIANDELILHYQPKVNLATGKVEGVESLVRWHHPKDGMVFPDQFICVAEEHGLIDDLTRGIVGMAFAQTRDWQAEGLYLRVAINISMDNLNTLAFVDEITAAICAIDISPNDIVLEVTESRLMKNLSAPLEILTRLRLKRFRLSIDDFGTGHSTLTQLRDIPFNELKIDRGFVHGMAKDKTLSAIFNASLGLAQQLDMETVAEGVETHEDWAFLRNSGCDLAQGYYIAKPMPASEIPDWINAWEANFNQLIEPPDACC
ncbi:MAG: EAL domain-containing response regulator [Methylomonas sp.]|jgi:EAL domain-containing protein (putative c-di-GMP-specific phosphodiesterase class I)/CheY-like chemotaxis protein|uniref:EAL domain-containing response regulator n=1 Tax=Methylomonas sp. TaxID=418 RepID=UPI0025E4FE5A|nr:EAL domain-containing response regulator [Methylomonas sp.]MCK9607480.1 EAL domain-containing response regulator [Methylomonas sp.]